MTTSVPGVTAAQKTLLGGAIDYAGLFPPASLSMADAARNYLEYATGLDAWALGKFVVPLARLRELQQAVADVALSPGLVAWRLSVVVGASAEPDASLLSQASDQMKPGWSVEAVEAKASTTSAVAGLGPLAGQAWTLYVEVPFASEVEILAQAVKALGACVKLRTGGITEDAFPTALQLASGLTTCARVGVPCKLTAGLHHPLRADYPLTYALNAARGTMFGYLNVLLAAALARRGASDQRVAEMLDERDTSTLSFTDDGVVWQGETFGLGALRSLRDEFLHGFGSCSFREPLDEFPHHREGRGANGR